MVSRRQFCALSLALPIVLTRRPTDLYPQGLERFSTPVVTCGDLKPTPAASDEATLRTGAPGRESLIEPGVLGQQLVLTGAVAGVVCGPIKHARIDFWQPDARGTYD